MKGTTTPFNQIQSSWDGMSDGMELNNACMDFSLNSPTNSAWKIYKVLYSSYIPQHKVLGTD